MAEGGQPPDMGDLLAYFEERSRSLDAEGQPLLDASTLQFISLIRFDGVPILPPVLSATRRQEMATYKREALRRQNLTRARKREELHAKVQSIVAGVEEKRAARQASKSVTPKSGKKQSSKMESVSRITTKSAMTEGGTKAPPEIIINMSASHPEPVTKSSKPAPAPSPSPKNPRRAITPSPSSKSPAKSSERMGNLSKQKSFSSQHLDRTPSRMSKDGSDSPGSAKNVSPNSGGLLPHPPQGKPLRKTSPIRQSSSTPDLRTIDFTVETDHLRKPFQSRDFSVKGGRPQSSDRDTENTEVKKVAKQQEKKPSVKPKSAKVKEEAARKDTTSVKDKNSRKSEVAKNKLSSNSRDAKSSPSAGSKTKPPPQNMNIQNPLEALERQISEEEEVERSRKFERSPGKAKPEPELHPELDPIQTAAAELFPFPISEEQALATLDSLHSDFASIEHMPDSLPGDYNGIPLTSMKQKQIIHMLTKLSKALNIEDTLTSTTSSDAASDFMKDFRQDQSRFQSTKPNVSVPNGASRRNANETVDTLDGGDDDSVNVTNDSNTTAHSSSIQSTSASSYHSRARMSPTGSSILSSASSVSGSRARMSPKSLKNTTVHFSSVVTEISTSASQSIEDKISYRKMDITPKSSENFDAEGGGEASGVAPSSGMAPETPNSLLSKVVLDSSAGSPGEIRNSSFESNSQDGELNTSDKENEFVPRPDDGYRNDTTGRPGSRNQQVLNVYRANIPEGPVGPNHPAVIKSNQKPTISESSSLKSDYVGLLQHDNLYGNSNPDITKLIGENKGLTSSTSSFQEDITRSYMQQYPEKLKLLHIEETQQDIERRKAEELEKQLDEMQNSHILLTPVFDQNIPKSLERNRSMLDDEEQIRSNLDRVHLEDDEDDVEEEEEEEEELDDDKDCDVEKKQNDVSNDDNDISSNKNENAIEIENESDTEEVDVVNVGDDYKPDNTVNTVQAEPDIPKVVQQQVEVEEEEEEGKAEHIQKYLNQVHEHSMQIEEDYDEDDEESILSVPPDADVMGSIGDVIQSFTSTIASMPHVSQEELFRLQAEQFEELQKRLIEQQRAQLEELFVSQRREQMGLQDEIEMYQKKLQTTPGQESIDTIQLKNTIPPPQQSTSVPQVTQAWQYQNPSVAMTPPFPVQPVASTGQYYSQPGDASFNTSYGTLPYPVPVIREVQGRGGQYPGPGPQQPQYPAYQAPYTGMGPGMAGFQPHYANPAMNPAMSVPVPGYVGSIQDLNLSHISHNTSYSTIPHHEPVVNQPPVRQQKVSNVEPDTSTSQQSNPFIYPSSPSLYTNPKDRDNVSDVSGFAKATPKQLVFSNQSTPVAAVKTFKPVVHSPTKRVNTQKGQGTVSTPRELSNPSVQRKFDRVSAAVKGYLTRRLLKTQKVQEVVKTIDDTRTFAFSFQAETPIKNGTFTREDRGLLERIVAQLQAALLDIHDIFFIIPVAERMSIIAASRQTEEYMRMRDSMSMHESVSRSQPKISKATLKAIERKRQAQIAEESVFGSAEFRPKSAPPKTSSPHVSSVSTDLSGPLRRHYHSLFVRALRPLQGHMSPIQGDNQITVREVKERPKTARDRTKTSTKTKKTTSGSKSARASLGTTSTAAVPTKQQKVAPVKTKKTEKAWR